MRPLGILLIYLVVIFVGGAAVAPWIYNAAQNAAAHWPVFQNLAASPFHRYVHRCFIGLALIGLWPFLRGLQLKSTEDLGLARSGERWKLAPWGFVCGLVSLALLVGAQILGGIRQWNPPPDLFHSIFSALGSGIAVALIEELLFRGALLGSLQKAFSFRVALWITSFFFALLHFFARPSASPPIVWNSGFAILGGMFAGFAAWETMLPAFFNLMLAGAVLGLARRKTNSLWFPIGWHAGWIFWIKVSDRLAPRITGVNETIWGTERLVDGWIALPFLLLLCFALRQTVKKSPDHS
jgi:membrane protease YdiL (CAAX protease family)